MQPEPEFCPTGGRTQWDKMPKFGGFLILSHSVTKGLGQNSGDLHTIEQQSGEFCHTVIFVLKVFLTLKIIYIHAKCASGPEIVGQNAKIQKAWRRILSFCPMSWG
ncbi:hypothetical protein [Methylococcus geothermalis]|uniref:Uncharacterized protein n=1 Tax=Methylococcus geothermalis TaxID=2681310 RepID=A0A858QBV8_9GAMM|nr:hypothetical protein [Methylococcus geothermalis]QJD31184.1 hypothetical protein GNH96_15370 [Methylococcus geothermalis]